MFYWLFSVNDRVVFDVGIFLKLERFLYGSTKIGQKTLTFLDEQKWVSEWDNSKLKGRQLNIASMSALRRKTFLRIAINKYKELC